MSSPQDTFQSVTGVDVELQIAGPGSRSYAFVIDWHIRLVLALAWFIVGTIVLLGSLTALGGGDLGSGFVFWVVLPSLAIYFLYHPVLEIAMHGRTPGKRIAGVRLVTRSGDIPGVGALLLRNIFRIFDSLPFAYLIGLIIVVFTEHHVRAGDLAAGTLLVMDHDSSAGSFAGLGSAGKSGLSPQAADLIQELLDRWHVLDDEKRTDIARSLLARLDRTVSADELASLDSAALRARLTALVSATSS
ncbi:MAG: RDD family protein [Steroidobacteraceae bacterium]